MHLYSMCLLLCISDSYSYILCLSYPLAIGLCSVHTINAAVDALPVNEYSSMKLQIQCMLIIKNNDTKYDV